ncbi:hypothetical protein [Botrimarina sp.]|uniref:hypothetical protein n=1 Tax=Botrimarina sp. TaxID=2795802 RepID=UPI0032EDDE67
MNLTKPFALLAVAVIGAPAAAQLPGQPLHSALTGAPGCEHVLDLLMRYGPLEGQTLGRPDTVVASPYGSFVLPGEEFGDLCLAALTEAPGDPSCPPTFVVAVTNNSGRPVCDVSVSLVALLGPIRPCDPTATVKIAEIPAGATVEVDITLPPEALAMGANGGAPVGFQKLLVAIDACDRYMETDEANNLHLVCRADIPQQAIAEEPLAEAAPPAAPVEPVEPVAPVEPAAPGESVPSSIDSALESFGLDAENSEAVAQRL